MTCCRLIASIYFSLMKYCAPMTLSQTVLLTSLGETVSIIPLVGKIWAKWNVKSRVEWISYGGLCVMLSVNFVSEMYCSRVMIHGNYIGESDRT